MLCFCKSNDSLKPVENNDDDIMNEIMEELNAKPKTSATSTSTKKPAIQKPRPTNMAQMNSNLSAKRKLSPQAADIRLEKQERPEKRIELDDNLINDLFRNDSDDFADMVAPMATNTMPSKIEIKQEVIDSSELEDIQLLASLSLNNLISSSVKVECEASLLSATTDGVSNQTQMPMDDNELKNIKIKLESNSEILFYWLDAFEETYNNTGCIYLFGKTQIPDEKADTFLSTCCIIKNIPRNIYVLPRKYKYDKKLKQENMDIEVTNEMVISEMDRVLEKYRIFNYRSKFVEKNFAFDSNYEVPYRSEYLKIEYSAEQAQLPHDIEGETFECIFGTSTSSLETVLLDLKLKGPCWLQVSVAQRCDENQISWCKLEYIVQNYKQISICKDLTTYKLPVCPPLVSMTFIIKTALNKKTQEHEIICACGLVNTKFYLDKTSIPSTSSSSQSLYDSYFCALSKPSNIIFPFDFNGILQNLQNKFKIEVCSTERALLAYVLCKIHSFDPDIIIGHDLFGYNFDILLNRCLNKKVPHWSRLGRLKRTYMPKTLSNQRIQTVCSGRLLCDIMISAKELLSKIKSYDLIELVSTVLKQQYSIDNEQIDVEKNIYTYYQNSQLLLKLIRLIMMDATYIYRICNDLNAIQLAYQLTCIAGNVFSRTLIGGRSERNEFLLLHAFYDKEFILPDKVYKQYQQHNAVATGNNKHGAGNNNTTRVALKESSNLNNNNEDFDENDDDTTHKNAKGSNKAKPISYTGGLVLEPKVGFYDHFILLLDFNSLYPSIIQEYNICFTTIPRPKYNETTAADLDEYLETSIKVPNSDDKPGILPLEIRKLVDSRKQVKQLLQKENLSSELKMQYDIRQKALKLTANSMYGCLGFEHSRFFCKPLAALITRFGRNILMKTKELVESKKIEVIYGDTDSIMINTNINDYDQVIKIGNFIRTDVNKLYKNLEIGIDGVFKCLLLLKKKKYAALCIDGKNPKDQTQLITHQEIKGLDIVRRDWCLLARQIGEKIISQILSGFNCDQVIQNINNILCETAESISKHQIEVSLFEINKQLNRNPEEYNETNHQSHVLVASRFNRDSSNNKKYRAGDVVSYIICDDGSNNSATQRAYLRSELENSKSLTIDYNYYLSQQIHPIISRLCEPIEGIDSMHIATYLGLDPANFKNKSSSATSSLQINPTLSKQQQKLQSYINEAEKYKNCVPFKILCPACKTENVWKEPFIKKEVI